MSVVNFPTAPNLEYKPVEFNISEETMNRLSRCFFYDASLIEKYRVDPATLDNIFYEQVFTIYNTLSEKGIQNLNTVEIGDVIDSYYGTTPAEKENLRTYFAKHKEFTEDVLKDSVKNIPAYYEQFRKEYTLVTYRLAGFDISPYWPKSPKYTRPDGTPDTRAINEARERFEISSADAIQMEFEERINGILKDPDKNLHYSSSIEIVRGDEIPGADKEIEYLIGRKTDAFGDNDDSGWMELGSFNSIVAAAKAGKTQLAMQMAFCVQNGIPFFGRETKKSEVLYVDFELRPSQIRKRLDMLKDFYSEELSDNNVTNPQVPYYISVSEAFSNQQIDLEGIIKKCKEFKIDTPELRMIVFDCFYTFMTGDSNSEEETKECLLKLKSLVSDNTSVCYVHHTNKSGTKGMSDLDMIYAAGGSGVHGKIVDTTYVARPKTGSANTYEVYATGRSCSGDKVLCEKNAASNYFFKPLSKDALEKTLMRDTQSKAVEIANDTEKRLKALRRTKEKYPEFYEYLCDGDKKGGIQLKYVKTAKSLPDEIKKIIDEAQAAGTKRDNILFGKKVTLVRYNLSNKVGIYVTAGGNKKCSILDEYTKDIPDITEFLSSTHFLDLLVELKKKIVTNLSNNPSLLNKNEEDDSEEDDLDDE